jgi:hypothetical protein
MIFTAAGRRPLPCHLILAGDSPHTRQVVTGFYELAAAGVVDLRVHGTSHGATEWLDPLSLRAVIAGHRVIYDANDGRYIPPELAPYLEDAECYFKRSIDRQRLDGMPASVRVEPLGLNYLVTSRRNLWHRGLRPPDWRRLTRSAARAEFGERFYGGFAIEEFSRREYGDCLLPDHRASERRAFLARVRDSAICVATTGLHGSIGWKMAEYVAASRAIVSEPLRYEVPGGFAAGRNFLEFTTLESFITSVESLLRDVSLREDIRRTNWDYYRRWVRPDAQVLRTLERVLGETGPDE